MSTLQYIALGLIAVGAFFMMKLWLGIGGHEITTGRVIEMLATRGSKGRTNYKPVALFTEKSGKEFRYTASWSTNPPSFRVGDPMRIMFDANDPSDSTCLSFGARFGWCWVMIGIGLLMLWISLGWTFGDAVIERSFPNTFSAPAASVER